MWYDFARSEGGGVIDLVRTVMGSDKATVVRYLESLGTVGYTLSGLGFVAVGSTRVPLKSKRGNLATEERQRLWKQGFAVVAEYPYAKGLQKVRFENPAVIDPEKLKPIKRFRWEHNRDGIWWTGKGGLTVDRLFTNATYASPDRDQVTEVIGVEGEKSCLFLDSQERPAFAFKEATEPRLFSVLTDLRVTLVPDADTAGYKLALARAAQISGYARSVRVAHITGGGHA